MTPDEVRMMDNRYALLFIRGERPIKDLKYDILNIRISHELLTAVQIHMFMVKQISRLQILRCAGLMK